jgi:transposase InsO family protein
VKFSFIKEHRRRWPVAVMSRVLKVSRSGFFAWLKRRASKRERRRRDLIEKIRMAYQENRELYGSPRVHRALLIDGEVVSRNTVAKLMRLEKIRARKKRKFVPRTTDSRHQHAVADNLLDRQFQSSGPDRKWVADITYVPTGEGWLYLAGVLDCFSRKLVGWSMADHMETSLAGDALRMALVHRGHRKGSGPAKELLHHSDRGVQYASEDYQQLLNSHGLTASMSGKGDCWDNAMMESFWATLKTELIHQSRYATRAEAKAAIFEYIEVFYNRKRLHSSLGYVSPEAFEAAA